ncbi:MULTISPECIES: metal ABC transporter permease [Micromonospora]|uniref:Metal ABC transporter permease n=1 Tax=Micromonospora solifontis TaxID=2487138 RepID=A0ABX9WB03_9ACTN|nr:MULTISPECIES: metal ABC transporter permease [Micromonospora]NES17021.1 metal ABC transporter permease [Micromonospora sp. PPF5-17B]NES39601.1 metal ABC transporter permease [Micromonospora solifontis]NES58762.1 metal ABC transporter permease [Micromonospora sp. PPF5-6]RNL87945.1 metal ABC transporter permease [Micromonospora solifontis]
MDLFQYDFMLRALVGALVIGLAAPALGIYLVQRRLALIGDGIGHVALTGVGAGLLLNRSPVLVAVLAATLGAIVIELVRARGRTSGDLALALLFYGGIAGGVMLVGLSDASSASLNAYLFGSLITTSAADLVTILVLGLVILVAMLALRPALFAVCHDEEYARVSGLPVRALNLLLAVATAVTVTIAMRAVGVLLISALMVVPVATAQQVTRGFRSTMAAAMALGLFAAGAGIWVAATADTAPGASVVLLAIASFLVVALVTAGRRALRRWSRPVGPPVAEPVADPPEHEVVLG